MSKLQAYRNNCKDVFKSFLVSMADYDGVYEFPVIQPTHSIPNRLIPFSKAISCKDHDQWVHFYQDDYQFERIWNNPKRYLRILKRYNGVILPDFSVYRDMPLVMQLWNIYRSRAVGAWLQLNGIEVVVNIRFGDSRTYDHSCDGVSKRCVIAVGTNGTLDDKDDRHYFEEGLEGVVRRLEPIAIVVYGRTPDDIFQKYRDSGIEIIPFESECANAHRGVI